MAILKPLSVCYNLYLAKECPLLSNITNGQIIYSDVGTRLGAFITYMCNKGYQLQGKSTRHCTVHHGIRITTYYWDGAEPKCVISMSSLLGFGLANALNRLGVYYWRASEASKTLIGLNNGNRRLVQSKY